MLSHFSLIADSESMRDQMLVTFLVGWILLCTNTVKVYGNFPALLVGKDLRCPSVQYFRHEPAPE